MTTDEWHDWYVILGLWNPGFDIGQGPDVTEEEIKKAYRDLQKKYNPDNPRYERGSGGWDRANELTQLINEAYEVLSNPRKKKLYDLEWERRRRQRKKSARPEIKVTPSPPDALEQLIDGITLGETREIELSVSASRGTGFRVKVAEPLPPWLEVRPKSGIVPLDVTVLVKTSGLQVDFEDETELVFLVEE